jgi:hypothetical protein
VFAQLFAHKNLDPNGSMNLFLNQFNVDTDIQATESFLEYAKEHPEVSFVFFPTETTKENDQQKVYEKEIMTAFLDSFDKEIENDEGFENERIKKDKRIENASPLLKLWHIYCFAKKPNATGALPYKTLASWMPEPMYDFAVSAHYKPNGYERDYKYDKAIVTSALSHEYKCEKYAEKVSDEYYADRTLFALKCVQPYGNFVCTEHEAAKSNIYAVVPNEPKKYNWTHNKAYADRFKSLFIM